MFPTASLRVGRRGATRAGRPRHSRKPRVHGSRGSRTGCRLAWLRSMCAHVPPAGSRSGTRPGPSPAVPTLCTASLHEHVCSPHTPGTVSSHPGVHNALGPCYSQSARRGPAGRRRPGDRHPTTWRAAGPPRQSGSIRKAARPLTPGRRGRHGKPPSCALRTAARDGVDELEHVGMEWALRAMPVPVHGIHNMVMAMNS